MKKIFVCILLYHIVYIYWHQSCFQQQTKLSSLQETYPESAPIWFSDDDDPLVGGAIERLYEAAPDKFNVSIYAYHTGVLVCAMHETSAHFTSLGLFIRA